jgi:hypothetical protein
MHTPHKPPPYESIKEYSGGRGLQSRDFLQTKAPATAAADSPNRSIKENTKASWLA